MYLVFVYRTHSQSRTDKSVWSARCPSHRPTDEAMYCIGYCAMASSRFHDDPARVRKQNEMMTAEGRYRLAVPGPGANAPFFDDIHIRLTKWGANAVMDSTDVESDLRGIGPGKQLSRDPPDWRSIAAPIKPMSVHGGSFPVVAPFVDHSRLSEPAWLLRGLETDAWRTPRPVDLPLHSDKRLAFRDTVTDYTRNHRYNDTL